MCPLYSLGGLTLIAILSLWYIARRNHGRSIAHLKGPTSYSWLVGNIPNLIRPKELGDADFEWTRSFGTAVRVKGTFGRDILFTSDPKAIQYVLNTSGYNFPKTNDSRAQSALILGKGIVWAEGATHARQRKIMNPGFSYSSLREYLPLFRHTAQKTVTKWKDVVGKGRESSVIDIPSWLARTSLEAMGKAALGYSFNAIDEEKDTELSQAYKNLFVDSFLNRSNATILFEYFHGFFPQWLQPVVQYIPTRQSGRLRNYTKAARRVAKSLMDRQIVAHTTGTEGGKDVMSILVRANLSEDQKSKLDDNEILAQLTTLILAGHETTANTVTWALYELAKHPKFQARIRSEIKAKRAQVALQRHGELGVADLDSMTCLLALIKATKTGEAVTSIPISKGQNVILSIAAYNRLKSVWGEDAKVWRPERFIDGVERHQNTNLGVFANIASFGSGVRGCIGLRFALIEMQAILIELIENFEFSPPPGNVEIIRAAAGIMTPMIKGSKVNRTELPLTVTLAT